MSSVFSRLEQDKSKGRSLILFISSMTAANWAKDVKQREARTSILIMDQFSLPFRSAIIASLCLAILLKEGVAFESYFSHLDNRCFLFSERYFNLNVNR